jgi:hypothetical protein
MLEGKDRGKGFEGSTSRKARKLTVYTDLAIVTRFG